MNIPYQTSWDAVNLGKYIALNAYMGGKKKKVPNYCSNIPPQETRAKEDKLNP